MEIRDGPYTVYAQIFPNGKMYVGITSQNPERRWRRGTAYPPNMLVRRAIDKYGWENVEKEIIASHLTKDEACNFERLLIEKFDLINHEYGYNLTKGGEMISGDRHTDESRRKMSEKKKGLYVGGDNYRATPVVCVETGEIFPAISVAAKSIGFSGGGISMCIANVRHTCGGFHWRKATKYECPRRQKPKPKKLLAGRKRPEISGAYSGMGKAVYCIDLDWVFPTQAEAAKQCGTTPTSIRNNCIGTQRHAGHYHWKYVYNDKGDVAYYDSVAESKKSGKQD